MPAPFARALGIAALCAAVAGPSHAQRDAPTRRDAPAQRDAPSAALLRVLAEAADGHRTGKPVYIVASPTFPHPVIGGFASQGEAQVAARRAGAAYAVFGPYVTAADRRDPRSRVVSVTLRVMTDGRTESVEIDPTVVDALFFTRESVEKFYAPYLSRVYGPEIAAGFLGDLGPVGVVTCHVMGSRRCRIALGPPATFRVLLDEEWLPGLVKKRR